MKKVLIIDDDKDICEVIATYLSEFEIDISITYDAKSAIGLMSEKEFDLVITDILMPELNGIELTEIIHRDFPKVNVLACSGGGESGKLVASLALDQAMEEGATNAILKPFSQEELMAKVGRILNL